MGLRLASFVIWALVAASAVIWWMRALPSAAPSAAVPLLPREAVLRGEVLRVLGPPSASPAATPPAAVAAPSAAERLRLWGVIATSPQERAAHAGRAPAFAVISVNGAAPRPYRVGAQLDEGLWLLQVLPKAIRVGPRKQGVEGVVELAAPALPTAASTPPGTAQKTPVLGSLQGVPAGGTPQAVPSASAPVVSANETAAPSPAGPESAGPGPLRRPSPLTR